MPAMPASPSKIQGRQWCDVDSEVTIYPAMAKRGLSLDVDGEVGVYASMSKAQTMTPASPTPSPCAPEAAPEDLSPGKKWCDVDGEIGVYPPMSKKAPILDVDGELSVYAAMAKAQTLTPASPPVLSSVAVSAPQDLSPGKKWCDVDGEVGIYPPMAKKARSLDVDGEVGVYEAMAKQARTMKARIARAASPQPSSVRKFEIHVKECQLQSFSFDYYMHGLVEETGEVFEAVRAVRSTASPCRADTDNVLSEIGDVLWYATSFSLEVGGELRMPESWPTAEAGSCEPEVLMLAAAARLSGRVKKSMRGDKSLAQFAAAMAQQRDELLTRCAEVAANHNANLQQCATMNVRKLSGRFERNTVRGDGDHR